MARSMSLFCQRVAVVSKRSWRVMFSMSLKSISSSSCAFCSMLTPAAQRRAHLSYIQPAPGAAPRASFTHPAGSWRGSATQTHGENAEDRMPSLWEIARRGSQGGRVVDDGSFGLVHEPYLGFDGCAERGGSGNGQAERFEEGGEGVHSLLLLARAGKVAVELLGAGDGHARELAQRRTLPVRQPLDEMLIEPGCQADDEREKDDGEIAD